MIEVKEMKELGKDKLSQNNFLQNRRIYTDVVAPDTGATAMSQNNFLQNRRIYTTDDEIFETTERESYGLKITSSKIGGFTTDFSAIYFSIFFETLILRHI